MTDAPLGTPPEPCSPHEQPTGFMVVGQRLVVVPDNDDRMLGVRPRHAAVYRGRLLIRESEWPELRARL